MPTYTVHAAAQAFTGAQRELLAGAITQVHADATGAPKSFVQTVFVDIAPGAHYIGGRPTDPLGVWVLGHIRSGRSAAVRTAITLGVRDELARITGTPLGHIWVYLVELEHTDMIEFGATLPRPGDEPTWITALPPEIRDRLTALD